MGKMVSQKDYRVVVRPRAAVDFGIASIGGMEHTPEQALRLCEDIVEDIVRHVDNTARRYIDIEFDTEAVCCYCGYPWSEESDVYNGGCCDEDEKNNPEEDIEDEF